MMATEDESFWNHDRTVFLIEQIRGDPSLWKGNVHTGVEIKFDELGRQIGTTGKECIKMFDKLAAQYRENQENQNKGKKSKVKWEYFDKMQFLGDSATNHVIEGYVNDGFSSASSEPDDPITSTVQRSRKRTMSSRSPKTFRRAAEYMVAELENMERVKAEILLNKTLKFFVEHRYD